MEPWLMILKDYGVWGLLAAVIIYIILNSGLDIRIRYPRSNDKQKR